MIGRRLAASLLLFVVLVGLVGGFGLFELARQRVVMEKILYRDYEAIQAINQIRTIKATLNSKYLPDLSQSSPAPDPSLFETSEREFRLHQSAILKQMESAEEIREVELLGDALDAYLEAMTQVVEAPPQKQEERFELLRLASEASERVSSEADIVHTRSEVQMLGREEAAVQSVRNSKRMLALGMGMALIFGGALFVQQYQRVLRPIRRLTASVREIQQRNFELSIPEHDLGGGEIGDLAEAFNEMAAELRLLQRETSEHLAMADLRNRSILTAFPSPIFVLDPDLQLVQTNPQGEQFLDEIGIAGRLPEKVAHRLQTASDGQRDDLPDDLTEAMLFRIDDEEQFFLPRIFRMAGEDGIGQGWAVVLADVTRFRWLDDMKMNALATVSHEIKTPLTGIRMVLHLLDEQKTGELNNTQAEIVGSAKADCERLLDTLESLLQLSAMEGGSNSLDREAAAPADLVANAAAIFSKMAAQRGIRIEMEIDGDLPEVLVDRMRIDEVFTNLVSNALKHSPDDGVIRISGTKRDSEYVRLTVSDQGAGIPSDSQDKIFQKFYRAPDQTVEGIGLGLAISQEIVRAHGGRIGFDSNPGEPTVFHVDLPIVEHPG